MATKTKKQPITTRMPAVTVEYMHGNQRRSKKFEDAYEAKRFFAAKEKTGKNPKVVGEDGKAPATAKTATKTKGTKPTGTKAKGTTQPKPEPKADKAPGVRAMRSRPYLAGTLIAKYGLAAGVTDAMVAELDEAYGKPNPTESQFCLKNAHHAARGYMGIAAEAVQ